MFNNDLNPANRIPNEFNNDLNLEYLIFGTSSTRLERVIYLANLESFLDISIMSSTLAIVGLNAYVAISHGLI